MAVVLMVMGMVVVVLRVMVMGRRLRSLIKMVSDDEELRGRNNATRLEAATYVQNPLPNAPCRFRLE